MSLHRARGSFRSITPGIAARRELLERYGGPARGAAPCARVPGGDGLARAARQRAAGRAGVPGVPCRPGVTPVVPATPAKNYAPIRQAYCLAHDQPNNAPEIARHERTLVPIATFMAACATIIAWSSPARAADISGSIILVAKRHVQDKLYGSTILLVRPIGADRHVRFIVNKPTQMTLGKLFPQRPSRKSPTRCSSAVSPEVIFALGAGRESPGGRSIRILDDLYLAIDSHVVDRVIEKQPSQARFLAGMVCGVRGSSAKAERRLWYVQDATTDIILRKPTDTMWEELVRAPSARQTPLESGQGELTPNCVSEFPEFSWSCSLDFWLENHAARSSMSCFES